MPADRPVSATPHRRFSPLLPFSFNTAKPASRSSRLSIWKPFRDIGSISRFGASACRLPALQTVLGLADRLSCCGRRITDPFAGNSLTRGGPLEWRVTGRISPVPTFGSRTRRRQQVPFDGVRRDLRGRESRTVSPGDFCQHRCACPTAGPACRNDPDRGKGGPAHPLIAPAEPQNPSRAAPIRTYWFSGNR
jgi:hypothetical protein